jgi:DNA-binding NarL/FixJ family response regulator
VLEAGAAISALAGLRTGPASAVKARSEHAANPRAPNKDGPETGAVGDLISVQICDDHALVRSGLRRLLETHIDLVVVGEAANADEAVALLGVRQPDVLLLDLVMPGRSGIEALPEIRQAAPETGVLVLSMQDDPAYVRRAFAAGATGYLLKEAAASELVQAIREVASGRRYVQSLLGARLVAAEAAAKAQPHADPLSEREHEVVHLLALGHTNPEIAKLLFISIRTAETHRARIMRKLMLQTRAELVRYALTTGQLNRERHTLASPGR